MVNEELGSGPKIDSTFDFEVSSTGDLETVSGREELQKDLALNMVAELRRYIGSAPTPNIETSVRRDARLTALADERVVQVESIGAEFNDREEIIVDMTVIIESGEEYNLVFNV